MVAALTMTALAGLEVSRPADVLIIAHRGASGHRPEHTIDAYRLAVEMGADFIEPDLVITKDGVLIARHENELSDTTDVEARFPGRRRPATIAGKTVRGWFAEDFTLAELKTLRTRERFAWRTREYDGAFDIPTLDEVIALAQRLGREHGRPIGIYPETKHPAYFRGIGLSLEDPLLAALHRHGWNDKAAPVFIQSFDTNHLRALRARTRVRLIQLVSSARQVNDAGLAAIASYADGVGAEKHLVQPIARDGSLASPTNLVARAHAAGLLVHVWTLRSEQIFLASGYGADAAAEYRKFRSLGVDGIFTDFPDVAVKALK